MSTPKLTFKEYYESKNRLVEAAKNNIPTHTVPYQVLKYCKLPVGESKETKYHISLKPRQYILVEWIHNDANNPDVGKVTFPSSAPCTFSNNSFDDSNLKPHSPLWNTDKLKSWLSNNTKCCAPA